MPQKSSRQAGKDRRIKDSEVKHALCAFYACGLKGCKLHGLHQSRKHKYLFAVKMYDKYT